MTSTVLLFLRHSKTDQFSKGATVVIGNGNEPIDPGPLVLLYLRMLKPLYPQMVLFPSFVPSSKTVPITYDFSRRSLVKALTLSSVTISYTLHSLRAGGATFVSNNGITAEVIKANERWKTLSYFLLLFLY